MPASEESKVVNWYLCITRSLNLAELRKQGYNPLGSSGKNAKIIFEHVNLMDVFNEISDGNNITKFKPDMEVFLKGAEFRTC